MPTKPPRFAPPAFIAVMLTLTLATRCAATFHTELEQTKTLSERIQRFSERTTSKVYYVAEDDYFGIGPFFIGTIACIMLPAATIGPAYVIANATSQSKIQRGAATAIGIGSLRSGSGAGMNCQK